GAMPATDTTVRGYTLTASSGTYTPITGTNSTATGDDGSQTNIPIGFTFNYGGANHTAFSINTNGFIRLNTTIFSFPYTNDMANTSNTNVIAPLWDDNNRGSGSISYSTTGTAPNRVLTVQWSNVAVGGGGSTGNS